MTTPEDRRPPSRRIADELRARIVSGELAPGDRLPSERVMADEYETARNTAREAVRILAAEGLVTAEHGRGAFVRDPTPLMRMGSDRYSPSLRNPELSPWRQECLAQGKEPRTEVLSVERAVPPAFVGERLDVNPKTKSVVRRENVFLADDEPVHRVTTFIPWAIAQGTGLTKARVGNPSGIYGVLEDQGYAMASLEEDVSTRMPTPDEAAALELPPGVPVLDVWHTSYTADGTAFEVTRFVSRGDRTALRYRHRVD